jgi:hypothetical protein
VLRAHPIYLQLRVIDKVNVGRRGQVVAAVPYICRNEVEALVQRTANLMLSVVIANQSFPWELAMSFT